jgi:hypothetical protein
MVSSSKGIPPMTGIVVDTPKDIERYRLLALRSALKLECIGIKRRGPSAASIIKKETGLKGSNTVLLERFEAKLRADGVLGE